MTNVPNDASATATSLRLWPGVIAVALQWLVRFGLPVVFPDTGMYAILGGLFGGLVVLAWWAFFSRAPRSERWGGALLLILAIVATPTILHPSVRTGALGLLFAIYAVPVLSLAFVAWAAAARNLPPGTRWATMIATITLACGAWALVRSDGITGGGGAQFAWRWSESPEERLLARAGDEPEAPVPPPVAEAPVEPLATEAAGEDEPVASADEAPVEAAPGTDELDALPPPPEPAAAWPGFRGPARDSVIPGVRIETDWATTPPVELWRRAVGPGWSSFAVRGDHFYTQEQRGEEEVVTCYDAATGEPVWRHRDPVRFWEANAGAGPRGTPTLHDGRVYSFGGTGLLNVLDADDGSVAWSVDAGSDAGVEVPYWGFSGSPLVVGDLVIVAAAGRLVAYDLAAGHRRWLGPDDGGGGYSSPHLLTLDGVAQVVLVSGEGATSVAVADGTPLWEHSWPGSAIVQPALTEDGDVLIGTESGMGRIAVSHGTDGWTTEELWSTNRLKPYFNDFVVHDRHVYGFDGRALACIDVAEGERQWKGGRYGPGQLVLLPDQDLLLLVTEGGDLALVEAAPDRFTEIARVPAIEGKTWNHPVLVGDVLLARNAQEMAAFRLTLAPR